MNPSSPAITPIRCDVRLSVQEWLADHKPLIAWLTGASLFFFFASILIAPVIILRIPADYFAHQHRPHTRWENVGPVVRITLAILKNLAGTILILVGIVMLVTPGQGLLTIALGFFMLDMPGKYRIERWLFLRPRILGAINWFRRRRGREPLRTAPAS